MRKIHVEQPWSPGDETRISAAGSVTYSPAFSKNSLSVSFLSRAGLHFVGHKETLPSLVHKARSPGSPLSLLFSFSEGSIFFIYIRILIDVLFTYVFIHFG